MANRDLLKEAIADAKAVKETAIANAKAALEEAFTPRLQSMFELKLKESMDELEEAEDKMEEAKDERYHASTTPEEDVIPLETQLQGGDGEVAGKTKKMNKHGSARFSDNPLATENVKESLSLKMMKEYEGIKIKS